MYFNMACGQGVSSGPHLFLKKVTIFMKKVKINLVL